MTREEFEAEMMARERERAWEEYQEAEKHRPWTDKEAEDKLANALSCVKVTGDGGEEYEEENDQEEEQFVQYDDQQQYYEEQEGGRQRRKPSTTTDEEGEELNWDQDQPSSPEFRKKSASLSEERSVGMSGWSAPTGSRFRS